MMRHRHVLAKFLTLTLLATVAGCAKQGYPSGGPRDTQPPAPLGCKPDNESRNFAASEFYIAFDEYVVLKDANNNVLVSPPLKNKPEYTTKGKGILVKLHDTLQANSTYLFQFKDAIADYTEGNLLPSFEYVFSTGKSMDTMMLAGRVTNARTGKPWDETVSVMAYREERFTVDSTDTIATYAQPDLVTRCDKEGYFSFHYIPEGQYRLIALADKNRNLRVDASEAAAWIMAPAASTDTIDSTALYRLRISTPDRRQQRILKAEFTGKGHIVVSTLLPMQAPSIDGDSLVWRLNTSRDTANIWLANVSVDSTTLILTDKDLNDTLHLRLRKSPIRNRKTGTRGNEGKKLMRTLCDGNKAFYDHLQLAFSTPVIAGDKELVASVMHMADSSVTTCHLTLDSNGMGALLDTQLIAGEKYSITLRDSLFRDIYGNYTDSLTFSLTPKDYSTLKLHIDNHCGSPLIVELLDSRDTVVASQRLTTLVGALIFKHIATGEYRLRAVIDTDSSGTWTPGDYRLLRQPEQCLLYEKTLQLREKWEMEERWTLRTPPN